MTAPKRMISYAQNSEDVVLRNAFFDQPTGFYVDVGAGDPVEDSVTKHFYDLGWHGINIEPLPRRFARLREQRNRDTNLQIAVGAENGRLRLTEANIDGFSTLDPGNAETLRAGGASLRSFDVEVKTLARVLEDHAPTTIDFLKVDVEGFEKNVLVGADLTRFRPRVIVVEDTRRDEWEPLVLEAGYIRTCFDGLNLFFVREEDADILAPRLSRPAVWGIDNYDPYPYLLLADAAGRFPGRRLREILRRTPLGPAVRRMRRSDRKTHPAKGRD